jgi:hypothetical protein
MSEPAKAAEDIAKKSGLFEKLQHPVLGPFITSWAVCNWKPLYLIICGFDTPQYTMDFVCLHYFNWNEWPTMIGWPVLFTLIYLSIGLELANWYLKYKHNRTTKRVATEKRYELWATITEGWRKDEFCIENNDVRLYSEEDIPPDYDSDEEEEKSKSKNIRLKEYLLGDTFFNRVLRWVSSVSKRK